MLIKSGKTLTVRGELNFNENNRIIVEPGATLVIDGGRLISNNYNYSRHCTDDWYFPVMWQGIEVHGNVDYPQTDSAQGTVIVKNRGIVENAKRGIFTFERNQYNFQLVFTSGGIVKLDNAVFRNCETSVALGYYHNKNSLGQRIPNKSKIQNCTFSVDAYFISQLYSTGSDYFVTLCDVDGVVISGNTFNNQNNILKQQRNGLLIYNASCFLRELCTLSNINNPCSNYIPNIFTNLNHAVYILGTTTLLRSIVSRNKFVNNFYGITLKNAGFIDIFSNDFNIASGISKNGKNYGIYLENCKDYKIEDNELYSSGNGAYGIIANNTKNNEHIYRNRFHNLSIGTQVEGGVIAMQENFGLQVKCNTYSNISVADLSFTSPTAPFAQGFCGSTSVTANNLFSYTINSSHCAVKVRKMGIS